MTAAMATEGAAPAAPSYEDSIRETAARHGWDIVPERGMLAVLGDAYTVDIPYVDDDGKPQVHVQERRREVRHRLGGLAERAHDARMELLVLADWYAEDGYRDIVEVIRNAEAAP